MSESPATAPTEEFRTPSARFAASLFVVFLAARLLVAHWQYFWVQDDISIAAGVASLLTGEPAGLYRYGPQIGYYRLVEALAGLLGGVTAVPGVMIGLSALGGAVVPVLGLYAFRRELAWRTRLLVALLLFANPLLWASSRYGNSGTIASAAAAGAIVVLSNRPRRAGEAAALVLLGVAMLLRADAVLCLPVVFLLLRRAHGSTRAAMLRTGAAAAGVGVVWLAASRLDSRMDDIVTTTGVHLFNDEFRTQFWEYLLWSFSPFVLLLAAWGWRDLLARRDALLAAVTLWSVPVFAFYFGSTTTPRYALLAALPVTICTAVGAERLAAAIVETGARRWIASAAAGAMCFLHLVVGLGQFIPDKAANVFTDAVIWSHDGPHWTGGWLWHGFADAGRTLSGTKFGSAYSDAVGAWLAAPGPKRRVVYVSDGHPAVAFRYHALAAGAHIVDRMPGPDDRMATTYEISGVRVTCVDDRPWAMEPVKQFDVGPGDELWNMRREPPAVLASKVPPGLTIQPIDGPGGGIRAYRFVAGRPGEFR